jgi:hypothetical protein
MRFGDQNIINNLRYRWPAECASLSDEELIELYNQFSMSDDHGNNDEKFPDWLSAPIQP